MRKQIIELKGRIIKRKKQIIELFFAVVLIIGAICLVQGFEKRYAFLDWRYRFHQYIHTRAANLRHKPLKDHSTIVVLIGDNEFWKGNYSGRTPLKQDNLGKLLVALSDLRPRVIALDFNFCAQTTDGSVLESDDPYKKETQDFVDDVKAAAKKSTIVLTKFLQIIRTANGHKYYLALPNKFDAIDPNLKDVASFGHINLTTDFRIIPTTLVTSDGSIVNSFSQAIAKAYLPAEVNPDTDTDRAIYYCGAYLEQSQFMVHSADEIINAKDEKLAKLKTDFAGRIVIVGGAWTVDAAADPNDKYTPITTVDSNYGPAGDMPAVFMHANWVESILAERTGRQFPDLWRSVIEFAVGLLSFLLFVGWVPGLRQSPRLLLAFQIAFFPVVMLFWILISYLGFQNFGLFIDPLPGLFGAFLALVERAGTKVWQWRQKARQAATASDQPATASDQPATA
jgi:CHASE2 domain-containing sensor protein